MPEVSRFDGIIIRMFDSDHNPPHFHAVYQGDEVQITITTIAVKEGAIERKSLAKVLEWADLHQSELMDNWNRLRISLPIVKIAPLKR